MSRRRGRALQVAVVAVVVVALAYAAVLAAMYAMQERLIFQASKLAPGYAFSFPGQKFEEVRVNVPGATLHALHFMQPAPRGLVFFLHGNAGNLSTWTTNTQYYADAGYDLFIYDYRGYGLSSGKIESEAQLLSDARAMWDTIAPQYTARKLPIVIYGRSLGTGIAVPLARDVHPVMLVLVSPFTSLAAVATRAYPFVPQWLVRYPLRSEDVIGQVGSPIVLMHGTRDEVVPPSESVALLTKTRSPAELVRVEGAGHNDLQDFPAYRTALRERLDRVAAP